MPRRKDKSVEELKLLLQADNAEIGIKVKSNNAALLRNRLYAVLRANRGDFTNELTLTPDPADPTILAIVHKEKYHE